MYQGKEYQKIFDELQKSHHLIANRQEQKMQTREYEKKRTLLAHDGSEDFHDVEEGVIEPNNWRDLSSGEESFGRAVPKTTKTPSKTPKTLIKPQSCPRKI